MLDFLINKDYYTNDFDGKIVGFNEAECKLKVKGFYDIADVEGELKQEEQIVEFYLQDKEQRDAEEHGFEQSITDYENWQEKLYNELKKEGYISIDINGLNGKDNWSVEINRVETEFPSNKFGYAPELISYNAIWVGELINDSLTLQTNGMYDDENINKDKELFIKWITDKVDQSNEFNDIDSPEHIPAIITSTAFNTKKDVEYMKENNYTE